LWDKNVKTTLQEERDKKGSLLYWRGPCGFRRKAILILICTNGKVVNPNQRRGIAMKIIRSQNKKISMVKHLL